MSENSQSSDFMSRLRELQRTYAKRFEILCAAGKVAGEFPGGAWTYGGRILRFDARAKPGAGRSVAQPLPGVAGVLARCFMVASIDKELTCEHVYGLLHGVRFVAQVTGGGAETWLALTPHLLNRVTANARRNVAESTGYVRACAVASFVAFLNETRTGIDERASTLLGRYIGWRHRIKNPARPRIDVDAASPLANRKYVPNLHRALGEARSRIRMNPELEPSPGFDLIRLEALTFAMATGMRIGELCSLSVRCLETHEGIGASFLRVATEKGQPPSARPIAEVWSAAVFDAFDYLLERCSAARQRAREIETGGFEFVTERLRMARLARPIDPAFQAQLEVSRLSPDEHFQTEEVANALDLSDKEFFPGGRFNDCVVELPRMVAARVVQWMDARLDAWDWFDYSVPARQPRNDPRTGQVGSRTLSAQRISVYAGSGASCLKKASWFVGELRSLLVDLSMAGAFEGRRPAIARVKGLKRRWSVIRRIALSNVGGPHCTAVDVVKLKASLAERYRADLVRHYKELVFYDDKGTPVTKSWLRPGVPERLSEHLIVVWENEFSGYATKGVLPRPISRADFYHYISKNARRQTIFERLSILDESGQPYSISPHQIRHWVTTAIFRSGPSEMMVDLWMGRERGQSRIYDHRTAKERAEVIRERYLSGEPPDDYLGRQVRLWSESGIGPEQLEEHIRSRLRVLHFVPTGGCSRELFLAPCTKGLMCLRGFGTGTVCPSFHIDVDDEGARESIIALKDQYSAMLVALYPMAPALEVAFMDELNSSEVLDQHLIHIREVIRGCEQALAAYERAKINEIRVPRKIPLKVIP